MFKLGFKEAEQPEIKLATFVGSWKKQGNSRKTSSSVWLIVWMNNLTMWLFDSVDNNKCGKFLMRWDYQTTLPVCWEKCVVKQQLELDMEQLIEKQDQVCICHLISISLFLSSLLFLFPSWKHGKYVRAWIQSMAYNFNISPKVFPVFSSNAYFLRVKARHCIERSQVLIWSFSQLALWP